MNKKIRDLQIQAFSECKTFEDSKIRTDEVFERFAELIVRECCVVMFADPRLRDVRTATRGCARSIKEHFGVEE